MTRRPELRTNQLRLRRWKKSDLGPFAALNSDLEVMEHFPSVLSGAETARMIDRIEAGFEEHGFGLWAIEQTDTRDFIGFTGLSVPSFEAHFTPAVEVGWRLARRYWGAGYATAAAGAAMDYGFNTIGLSEIVSFATPANTRSTAVMARLRMTHDPADDFDHPNQPKGSHLRRHVLCRMSTARWSELRRD